MTSFIQLFRFAFQIVRWLKFVRDGAVKRNLKCSKPIERFEKPLECFCFLVISSQMWFPNVNVLCAWICHFKYQEALSTLTFLLIKFKILNRMSFSNCNISKSVDFLFYDFEIKQKRFIIMTIIIIEKLLFINTCNAPKIKIQERKRTLISIRFCVRI